MRARLALDDFLFPIKDLSLFIIIMFECMSVLDKKVFALDISTLFYRVILSYLSLWSFYKHEIKLYNDGKILSTYGTIISLVFR